MRMQTLFGDPRTLISSVRARMQERREAKQARRQKDRLRETILVFLLGLALIAIAQLSFRIQNQEKATEQINSLRAEVRQLRTQSAIVGTSGSEGSLTTQVRSDLISQIKHDLQREMGLLPIGLMRQRAKSFVEMYSFDNKGASNYGTAGYLGEGYFITVKHGAVALGQEGMQEPSIITLLQLRYEGRLLSARVVDAGDANAEVDSGDWAILKVQEPINLPPLVINLTFGFDFADPIFRLGNDYSKGIIVSTGLVGQRTDKQLVTCLTDGHPGAAGGGVLNQIGELVAIPVGRMQGDFRFSFILPLRAEMFRKVPHLRQQ